MASEFTSLILRAALMGSVAIAALLVLRTLLRRWLGANVAYQAWSIVPAVTVAAMLPAGLAPVIQAAPALRPVQALAARAAPLAAAHVDLLLLLWACGLLAGAAWFVAAHAAFLRRAGRLTRSGDVHVGAGDVGPASVGLFRPRIIVPHDFRRRYSLQEQVLVIAHERTHILRRDAWVNLLAAVFQCIFWFNPLAHVGVRFLRQDQEIACDAIVMQQHPRQRRTYAEALLKFHTGVPATRAGIHCHWQSHHPTKERLMSLQLTPSSTVRRAIGRCVLACMAVMAVAGTISARAEQAATAPVYRIEMTLDANGEQSAPRVLARAGEQFAVASGQWRVDMTVRQAEAQGAVWLTGRLFDDGRLVGTPTLLARLNEPATVKVDGANMPLTLSMTVLSQP